MLQHLKLHWRAQITQFCGFIQQSCRNLRSQGISGLTNPFLVLATSRFSNVGIYEERAAAPGWPSPQAAQ